MKDLAFLSKFIVIGEVIYETEKRKQSSFAAPLGR